MTSLLASGCKISSCFQQGFDHPTVLSEVAGLAVIAVVVVLIRAAVRR